MASATGSPSESMTQGWRVVGLIGLVIIAGMLFQIRTVIIVYTVGFLIAGYFALRLITAIERIADAIEQLGDG